jgi:RimJ/RimL family protein N-acetyltransferase
MELQSLRTKLRRFKLSDLENMIKLESDPDIMKFTPSKIALSREVSQTRLQTLVGRELELHPFGVWAAETIDTNDFIGWFMLLKTDLPYPEIGFMIIKKYWGMKYTTEISQAIIRHAFLDLKVKGISARTTVDNRVSITVLEKLGFEYIETKVNTSGDMLKFFTLKKTPL